MALTFVEPGTAADGQPGQNDNGKNRQKDDEAKGDRSRVVGTEKSVDTTCRHDKIIGNVRDGPGRDCFSEV